MTGGREYLTVNRVACGAREYLTAKACGAWWKRVFNS